MNLCKNGHDLKKYIYINPKTKYKNCKKCMEKSTKKWRNNLKNKNILRLSAKKSRLKSFYGLSWDKFTFLYKKQKGKCGICSINFTSWFKNKKNFCSVDHNHKNLKIRALLCNMCNRGLGMFSDDYKKLFKAYKYLKKHK